MPKKCATCGILLDVPCPNSACPGHQNESIGNICAYCSTNERGKALQQGNLISIILSSLSDAVETKLEERKIELEDL